MIKIEYDVKRGADVYRKISDSKLRNWILSGMIKRGDVVVCRSGHSGWSKAEEVEELKWCFERCEKENLERIQAKRFIEPITPIGKRVNKILIIDDEEDLCWLLSNSLGKKGYEVLTANTKHEGINYLKERPDLILLDLKLPDGDGIDMLDDIKAICPQCMVVIISAYGSEERRGDAMKKGVYGFMDKPIGNEEIMKIIEKLSSKGKD